MRIFNAFLAASLMIAAAAPGVAASDDGAWPAPIASLAERGVTIVERFDAPGGLTGFAAKAGGRRLALYLTPDKKHVLVGTLLDADARDLSAPKLEQLLGPGGLANAWKRLGEANYVVDGKRDAPRTIYEFTDPNCPYCHSFYQQSRPQVKAGELQIRHLPVAVLKPSSLGKAAAILGADDPKAALVRHENTYESGGIAPMDTIPAPLKDQVADNTRLMSQLEIRGTPGIVYRDVDGRVHIQQGLPQGDTLGRILRGEP